MRGRLVLPADREQPDPAYSLFTAVVVQARKDLKRNDDVEAQAFLSWCQEAFQERMERYAKTWR